MPWEKLKVIEHWAWDNFLSLLGAFIALAFHNLANRLWKAKINNGVFNMLEKVELQGPIGKVGEYSVDVTPDLHLKVSVGVNLPILEYLKALAAKTGTPIDDKAIEWIESILVKPAA